MISLDKILYEKVMMEKSEISKSLNGLNIVHNDNSLGSTRKHIDRKYSVHNCLDRRYLIWLISDTFQCIFKNSLS